MEITKRVYINTFLISVILLAILIFSKDGVVTSYATLNNPVILFTTYDWFIIIFTWLVIVSGFGMFIKGRYDKKIKKK